MTEEEKIRAYDVALDAAKSIYDRMKECQNYGGMEDLEAIFPQLSENEDEATSALYKMITDWLNEQYPGEMNAAIGG